MITKSLEALLAEAKSAPEMTREQRRWQRISFAYGNAKLSNPEVTYAMCERASDMLALQQALSVECGLTLSDEKVYAIMDRAFGN